MRRDLTQCDRCGRTIRINNVDKHQLGLECRTEFALADLEARGWVRCAHHSVMIRKAGFEVRYVPGRVERKAILIADRNGTREEYKAITVPVPVAKKEVVQAAHTISSVKHLGRDWVRIKPIYRHAMLRLLVREPERGNALLTLIRLGGEFPKEWIDQDLKMLRLERVKARERSKTSQTPMLQEELKF